MTDQPRRLSPPAAALERVLSVQSAVSSVALSHPEACGCLVCRAAGGDQRAFALIFERLPPPATRVRCPRCGMVSAHPTDAAEGYCGACHDWTGQ